MNKQFPNKTQAREVKLAIGRTCVAFGEGHELVTQGNEVGYFIGNGFRCVYTIAEWSENLHKALLEDLEYGVILPTDFNEIDEWLWLVGYSNEILDEMSEGKDWCDKYVASL